MSTILEKDGKTPVRAATHTYLTFKIQDVIYGINASSVCEITKLPEIVHVPKMPEAVVGVINLREKLIPVIDLRTRLGLPKREYDSRTCIIIIKMEGNETVKVGIIVDIISEARDILDSEIDISSNLNFLGNNDILKGIALTGKIIIMLLNVETVINPKELENYLEVV